MVRINGVEYAWGDISVVMLGRPIVGLTGIDYTSSRATATSHGAGVEPSSVQKGKRDYKGTMTVKNSEVSAMNRAAKAAGKRDLLDIYVDVIVVYASETGVITTDIISQASFSEIPKGMKEGDLISEHALPFVALDIDNDAV